jgi:putative membrane protein
MYLWVKAIHLIFVVAWIAGLLIYPRYKIHQLNSKPGSELFETMKESAQKLRKIILAPSIAIVWLLGLALLGMAPVFASSGWFWVKFALVIVISGIHGFLVKTGRRIDDGEAPITPKKLKLLSEVPFIAFAIIAIMVIVKPF